jgi:hypothetical protein
MVDEKLLELSSKIDDLLMDSCLKYEIDFDVMTAVVLARIVALSRQFEVESGTSRLLFLAQSSIMETPNQTLQ